MYSFVLAVVSGVVLAAAVLIGMAGFGGKPDGGWVKFAVAAIPLGVLAGIGLWSIQFVAGS